MKKNYIYYLLAALAVLSVPAASYAQSSMSGEEIIYKVYNRSEPSEQSGTLVMTLINSRGEKRVREISQYIRLYGSDEKKIMFFQSPADVKNTSFMNWSYDREGKEDDQWIYLPALKKIKRISSDSKGDYFMGSDFTYDDLGDRHQSEDTHRLTGEDIIDGVKCLVVESISKDDDYMYSKTVTWIIPDKWIGLKKDFYDEDGNLFKTLKVNEYTQIREYWIITGSEMHNLQKDHTTTMELSAIKLDTGIEDSIFTERMMTRGVR
jgi:outer membrane lipoprotein-sorting protein